MLIIRVLYPLRNQLDTGRNLTTLRLLAAYAGREIAHGNFLRDDACRSGYRLEFRTSSVVEAISTEKGPFELLNCLQAAHVLQRLLAKKSSCYDRITQIGHFQKGMLHICLVQMDIAQVSRLQVRSPQVGMT